MKKGRSLNGEIAHMIHGYPSLFQNRTQALVHLYASIGTGYVWRLGCLTSIYDDVERSDDDLMDAMPDSLTRIAHPAMAEEVRRQAAEWRARNASLLVIRRDAERLALTPGPLRGFVPSPYEGLPMNEVPEDAEPDWRAGAEEVRSILQPMWDQGLHLEENRPKVERFSNLSPEALAHLKDIWNSVASDHS